MADDLTAALMRELASSLPEPLSAEFVDAITRLVTKLSRESLAPDPAAAPQLLTVAEVAARLRVSPKWVYAHQHELGPIRLGDGPRARLRFDAQAVAERVTQHAIDADGAADYPPDEPTWRSRRRTRRRLASRPLPPNGAAQSGA